MRVSQRGGELDFAKKALGSEAGRDMRMDDLERDQPLLLQVLSQKKGRHATATELTLDTEAVGQGVVAAHYFGCATSIASFRFSTDRVMPCLTCSQLAAVAAFTRLRSRSTVRRAARTLLRARSLTAPPRDLAWAESSLIWRSISVSCCRMD